MRFCIQCGNQRKPNDLFCKDCFSTYRLIIPQEHEIINQLVESEIDALDHRDEEILGKTKTKLLKIKRILDLEAKKLNNIKANLIAYISAINEKLE